MRRLAALMRSSGNAAAAAKVAKQWRLSNRDHERLAALLSPPANISDDLEWRGLRRELYAHGGERVIDWLMLAWAERAGDGETLRPMIEQARQWRPATLPVKGTDALALGIPSGPEVGEMLEAVEHWWIAEDFAPTRDECLDKLRVVAASRGS